MKASDESRFTAAARQLIELYSLKTPYHRGKWRVVEGLLRVSGVDKRDTRREYIVERGGVHWRLNTQCVVQRRLYYHGGFDKNELGELTKRLGRGSVFLDVGSYFGYYALEVAQRMGDGVTVHAFEPAPNNFKQLMGNVALNGYATLKAHNVAIGDVEGAVGFEGAPEANGGTGRIVESSGGPDVEKVRCVTLDGFVEAEGITRVDGMKIDVEGAETRVLAGGRRTLERFKPTLVVEYNPPCLQRYGTEPEALLRQLRDLGYEIYRAKRDAIERFTGLKEGESYANVLCVAARE